MKNSFTWLTPAVMLTITYNAALLARNTLLPAPAQVSQQLQRMLYQQLYITSAHRAFLVPRITPAQRSAIVFSFSR